MAFKSIGAMNLYRTATSSRESQPASPSRRKIMIDSEASEYVNNIESLLREW